MDMGLYLHNSYTHKAQIRLLHAQLIHNITQSIHNIIQKLEAVQSSSKLLRRGRTSYPFVLDSLVDSMVVLVRASLAAGLFPDLRACEKAIGHIFILQRLCWGVSIVHLRSERDSRAGEGERHSHERQLTAPTMCETAHSYYDNDGIFLNIISPIFVLYYSY